MILLDLDDHHLHILRMLAGAHGQTAGEYLHSLVHFHCKHLATDTDRGLAFAAAEFLNHRSIPELTAVLLHNAVLGYEMLGDADGKDNP